MSTLPPFSRRTLIAAGLSTLAAPALSQGTQPTRGALGFGPAQPFSFETLTARARRMAGEAYVPPPRPMPDVTRLLDYDAHGRIRYRTEAALFAEGPGTYPVTFFHLGEFFPKKVAMHLVEGGRAREILYSPELFNMPADSPARRLPADAGFAGFRLQEARTRADWRTQDWVAFLGASYFRAIGDLNQYGLSARGIAIDVANPTGGAEEFPDFTHVYIEAGQGNEEIITCLLDGPSITGAFRFVVRRTAGVEIDVHKHLFLRRDVARLGIAPLTSMYWYSDTRKPTMADWRPEVHDSDGLQLLTGRGERIWRQLNNPARTMANAFGDENPRGFGLMQRDREFNHYMDGVHYERRPSLWVQPVGNWGRGSVQLIEIPTDDEIHDNIVAMWVPEGPARAGMAYEYRYKTWWQASEPDPGSLARVVATRLGNGGQPGQPRPRGVRKFMVEFLGGPLANLPFGVRPEPVVTASRGTFGAYRNTEPVPNGVSGHWRTQFDLATTGSEPVDMRLFLRVGDQIMTETWLYQYHPTV
jgi:periplasmic glucans biosynthesis protein